jgi:EAL domain-containing protein (putative c-di-GMP-specific phosphodiesterase class I)
MRVVAEGVETREQLKFLKAHGCDEIQGFLFSKPLPARDFLALLHRH